MSLNNSPRTTPIKALLNSFAIPHIKLMTALAVACFISALAVVFATNQYMQSYIAYQKAVKQGQKLLTTENKLRIEFSTWSQYQRVHDIATEQLGMQYPTVKSLRILA